MRQSPDAEPTGPSSRRVGRGPPNYPLVTLHFIGASQIAYRDVPEGDFLYVERDVDPWWNGVTHQTRNGTPLIYAAFNFADFSNPSGEMPPILECLLLRLYHKTQSKISILASSMVSTTPP